MSAHGCNESSQWTAALISLHFIIAAAAAAADYDDDDDDDDCHEDVK